MGAKHYTEVELRYLRRYYPVADTVILAQRLGRKRSAINLICLKLGVKKSMRTDGRKTWGDNDIRLLCQLYPDTHNSALAKFFGVSANAIVKTACICNIKKSEKYMLWYRQRTSENLNNGENTRFCKGWYRQDGVVDNAVSDKALFKKYLGINSSEIQDFILNECPVLLAAERARLVLSAKFNN